LNSDTDTVTKTDLTFSYVLVEMRYANATNILTKNCTKILVYTGEINKLQKSKHTALGKKWNMTFKTIPEMELITAQTNHPLLCFYFPLYVCHADLTGIISLTQHHYAMSAGLQYHVIEHYQIL
jgi:hypothetical protein